MTDSLIYPLTFSPQLRHYLWGGRNLEKLYGRQLPPGLTAESWEISGHPTAATAADNGPLAGESLPKILYLLGEKLVGTRAGWALERHKFPLLVKLLDANQNLSVQVHPGDEYALRYENELGKTEMWYALRANPGARLIFGLKAGVTPQAFRRAIEAGTLEDYLHTLPVKAGDAIFVESGSVHALLAGAVVAEIQQNSDLTYRVYDWDRVGDDGKPRPLHIDQAIQVINFQQIEPGPVVPRRAAAEKGVARWEISRCKYFVVEKVEMEAGAVYAGRTTGDSLEIWGCVEGEARLTAPPAEAVQLPAIRFSLLPAALGAFSVTAQQESVLLRVYLP